MRTGILLVAGGRGLRAGGETPKQFREVAGRPLLLHSLAALLPHADVPPVIALPAEFHAAFPALLARHGFDPALVRTVEGGAERVDSVANGVAAFLEGSTACRHLLVHDAARPFVPRAVVERLKRALAEGFDAAVPVLPQGASDTLAALDESGLPLAYPPRDRLFRVQTPQGFRLCVLADALARRAAFSGPPTDESSLLHRLGYRVATVPGDERMFKVTGPEDFARAATLFEPGK